MVPKMDMHPSGAVNAQRIAAFVVLKHDCTLKPSIICSYMNANSNQMPVFRRQIMKRPGPARSGGLDADMYD